MKKNIIIGLLTIVTLLSWTYAYYWKSMADKQTELAVELQKSALQHLHEEKKQRLIAEEALKQCATAAARAEEQARAIESKSQNKE